ncbi:MAG: hypothetical protein AYK23_03110 [Candidatus Proteinoplasmatales archaeon SG8-5]|nr:MAG: hypothetical protein AYK23_03110 [Candidatus Proteinoplasmatales archaeon SG8-5]
METSELFLPLVVLGILIFMLILGLHNRVIARLGLRNFYRHRGHAIISVAGLLVGTSIICASMVVGDSIEYFIVEETYETLQDIDMVVTNESRISFDDSVFLSLYNDADVTALTDGMAPLYAKSVTVRHSTSQQFEPSNTLIGYDPTYDADFGDFITVDGSVAGSLGANDTMINQALAATLEAEGGDVIVVSYSTGSSYGGYGQIETRALTVRYILEDSGKTLYNPIPSFGFDTYNIFVNIGTAQEMFSEPDMYTHIKISNNGGVIDGADSSDEVQAALESALSGYVGLEVNPIKQNNLETAKAINDLISTFLTIFGSFAIIAGVILIINIFTMLAEERKSELGMARAVGMKRRHLMQSFLYEGLTYGLVASAMGVLIGLLVGMVLIWMVNNIITFIEISLPFKFQWFSLVSAFSLGFIITFGTILLTSWNISKLNIIRAIRGIENPVREKKGFLLLAFGTLFLLFSVLLLIQWPDDLLVKLLAPSGALTGLAMILWRWIGDRLSITGASLGIFVYTYYAIHTFFVDVENQSMDIIFISSGVIIVLSLVLLIMYNSKPVIWAITRTFGRVRKWRPTIETAVSYPLTKKFRTGMSVAMFALVVYMIVMLSVFSNMFTLDIDEETLKQGGGYDIQADVLSPILDINNVTYFEPTLNMSVQVNSDSLQNNVTRYTQVARALTMDANVTDSEGPDFDFGGIELDFLSFSFIYGIDDNFHENRYYEFSRTRDDLSTTDEVWTEIMETGSTEVIISTNSAMLLGADVGNHVKLKVNIINEYVVPYAAVNQTAAALAHGEVTGSQYLFKNGAILIPGLNYTLDPATGEIEFLAPLQTGDQITATYEYYTQEYEIIAVMDQSMIDGIFMSRENMLNDFGNMGMVNSLFLFEVNDGYDVEATTRALESDFAVVGMNAVVVREIAETTIETLNSMFVLFELYLDMGLVVGVAGLGIITIRSVVERTPEIGILRSLGFKRSSVRNAFLIEILFIATLGVIIGIATGLIVSYEIFNIMISEMGGNIAFEIPWFKIAYVTAIAYGATIICTIIPARNASKIAPAEALRYVG